MSTNANLMFALQSPIGLRFGATIEIDSDRITFEMDMKIPKGTECPFRMELSGQEDTVMGEVRIERILPPRGGSLPRFIARITSMPPEDRQQYDGWRRDLATGGVSRRLEQDPDSLKEQMSRQMMSGATEEETRRVLERMNSKRRYKRKEEGRIEGDPFGLEDETEAEARTDSASLRAKLRNQSENKKHDAVAVVDERDPPPKVEEIQPEIAPETPTWLPETKPETEANQAAPTAETTANWIPAIVDSNETSDAQPSTPTQAKPSANAVAPPAPEPSRAPIGTPAPSPPIVVVDTSTQPHDVTIIYLSKDSFQHDYNTSLRTSAITINDANLTLLYLPLRLTLQIHDGTQLNCMGQTVAILPDGVAVALELNSSQLEQLKTAAGH